MGYTFLTIFDIIILKVGGIVKRIYLIITFFVSLFVLSTNVNADYKANALNPSGAKCSLVSNSTGYCFYANSNLNSVNYMKWLDTGDEVTVITSKEKIKSNDNICQSNYVYVSQFYTKNNNTYYGYYCEDYLSTCALTDELKNSFRDLGFPESYWENLAILKTAHPSWSFIPIKTNLNFSDVVTEQTYGSRSLLRGSMSNNYSYLRNDEAAFNYYGDYFIPYDDTTGRDPWYLANYNAIAYYVDPRNFLSDMYIFQFETLSYDDSVDDEKLKKSINSIFGSDYLSNFTDDFVEAGHLSGVNPIYLASLSKEEISNGITPGTAIDGVYNGMYNFYNIGATGGEGPVYRGLNFAANTDEATMRPWNTEYKAIVGGAKWIFNSYVYPGQDTSYFKKYNVVYNYLKSINRTPTYSNYSHQYMQNIAAPSSEAWTTYKSYYNNNMLDLSYTFYIPVYNNMPAKSLLPTSPLGWPNNYLKSLSINGKNIPEFDGGVEVYNYNLDANNNTVSIDAVSVSNSAKVEGIGTFKITENTTRIIKVTAENGNVKEYKININLVGEKQEPSVDLATTMNNSGIKNGNKYLSGFSIGSDISIISQKIMNANKDANVILKNSSGNIKNNGVIATGDKVVVTVGNETKEYEVVIYGDVNGDGKISAVDYVRIKNNIMGKASLYDVYREAADVDKNGKISAVDYVRIKNNIMGIAIIYQ